ncbi:beta-galactosidase 3-like [Durio zibethinus]|uniref:Beta-galactosidase 3-like n=1 Tax=Durio zibethinus TaxID=66656 RepID=A0A6P5ZC91_DURZI|nr:beta-galactosidase 3-like [Durio zibethinus]
MQDKPWHSFPKTVKILYRLLYRVPHSEIIPRQQWHKHIDSIKGRQWKQYRHFFPDCDDRNKLCGYAYEGSTLKLSCQAGRTIADIQFASFGGPRESSSSYKASSFEATNSLAAVEKACAGRPSCSIDVS